MCPTCLCYRILLKLFTTGSHVVPVADGVPMDPEVLVSCLFVSFSPIVGKLLAWLIQTQSEPQNHLFKQGVHILLQVVRFSYPIKCILHTPLLFLSWEKWASFWRSNGLWMWPKHGTGWKMDHKTDWVFTSQIPTTWSCSQVEFSTAGLQSSRQSGVFLLQTEVSLLHCRYIITCTVVPELREDWLPCCEARSPVHPWLWTLRTIGATA